VKDILEHAYTFRLPNAGDVNLILDAWIQEWKKSPWAGCVGNHDIFRVTRETIEQLLARGARLLLAVRKDNPKKIWGFVCYERVRDDFCVHWVWTRERWRKTGIATALLREARGDIGGRSFYSFRTHDAKHLFTGWTHAPEIARRK
jgi:GNAT superfamily N-acetyltransferase